MEHDDRNAPSHPASMVRLPPAHVSFGVGCDAPGPQPRRRSTWTVPSGAPPRTSTSLDPPAKVSSLTAWWYVCCSSALRQRPPAAAPHVVTPATLASTRVAPSPATSHAG